MSTEDEVTDLFFGDDDAKSFDVRSRGRMKLDKTPKVKEQKNKIEPSKKIDPELAKLLTREVKFLKQKVAQVQEIKRRERDQKLDSRTALEVTRKIAAEKRNKKAKKLKGESYLTKYGPRDRRNVEGVAYAYAGSISSSKCIHDDTYVKCDGGVVISKCIKCSREKQWQTHEFIEYWNKKHGKAPVINWFNPAEFGMI